MTDEQQQVEQGEELLSEEQVMQGLEDGGLQARVDELENQLAEAKDQALRAVAEMQNIRRRAEQDVEKAHKFALEKFAGDMLAVVDTLERAVQVEDAGNEAIKPMVEGMQLTLKLLLDTLRRYQVERVDPLGQPFNPELHQAMAMEESATAEPDSVLKVFQCGYTLSGRLLRPAMVVVSKAPSEPLVKIDEQA